MTEQTEKYNRIIEDSFDIFMRQGIRNVSMDDLCRQMGISKKTLYKYVENKSDLVERVIVHIRTLIDNRICQINQKELNAIDILLEMSKTTTNTHTGINPYLSFEIRKFYPKLYEKYLSDKKELLVKTILENLEKGIKEGLYRQDLNKEIVAHLYFKKIEELHTIEGEDLENFSHSKVFEVMFENHIRGIANEEGIAYFEKRKKTLNFNI